MKPLRRAPREVYRVYGEEEFLADTAQELTAPSAGLGLRLLVASVFVLVIGAASLLAELLTSPQRSHARAETRGLDRDPPRASAAAVLRRIQGLRAAHRKVAANIARGARRRSVTAGEHRGHATAVQVNAIGGSISVEGHRAGPVPSDAAPVNPGPETVQPAEFGFER